MQVYLPIAEMPVDVLMLICMGIAVGFLSGMFGIGGGFLMTPMLIFLGIPPAVAVATVSGHIAASSCSGVLSYAQRNSLDLRLGMVLLAGGGLGTALGVWVFAWLRRMGYLDLTISLSYVLLLTLVGGMMMMESLSVLFPRLSGRRQRLGVPEQAAFIRKWPGKMYFARSGIVAPVVPVIVIGLVIGFLGAVLGIGGGFILVPALYYILRVPTQVCVGTSLFMTLLTMLGALILHSVTNASVDIILAFILMVGGVVGAQFGARAGQHLKSDHLRFLLAVLILGVGVRFGVELAVPPSELYTLAPQDGVR